MRKLLILVCVLLAQHSLTSAHDNWIGQKIFWRGRTPIRNTMAYLGDVCEPIIPCPVEVVGRDGEWLILSHDLLRGAEDSLFVNRIAIPVESAMRTDEAARYFSDRLCHSPNARDYAEMSAVWLELGDYDSAQEDASKAIKLDPKLAIAYYRRAVAESARGRYELAREDISVLLTMRPDCPLALRVKGDTQLHLGQYDGAIVSLSAAIKQVPLEPQLFLTRACAWFDKGEFAQCVMDCTSAIRLNPTLILAYIWRGTAFSRQGLSGKAIKDLTTALDLAPDSSDILERRALLYFSYRNYQQAINDYSAAIKIRPTEAKLWFERGQCYRNRGQLEQAMDDLNRAIELEPTANAYYVRACLWGDQSDHARANADLEMALRIDPDHAFSHRKLRHNQRALGIILESPRVHPLVATPVRAENLIREAGQD